MKNIALLVYIMKNKVKNSKGLMHYISVKNLLITALHIQGGTVLCKNFTYLTKFESLKPECIL